MEKIGKTRKDKSSLSTISDYVSKALNDEKITHEEYSLIASEHDKFREIGKISELMSNLVLKNRIKKFKKPSK